jgi:glycyl-tRNA synthetase
MLEISSTCITPHVVLENSGHVARFTDLLVKDVKTGQGFRADKLLSEWLENKLEKGKLKEAEI